MHLYIVTEWSHSSLDNPLQFQSAVQKGFQITDHDMHQRQSLGSLRWWCNPFVVNMLFSNGVQRWVRIRSEFWSRPDMTVEKITHTAFADFLNRFRCLNPVCL